MQNLQHHDATTASSALPEALQRRHVSDRIAVSSALAGAISDLAFGRDQREDLAALASLTAARTASSTEGRLNG